MIPDEAIAAAKEAMREVTPPPGITKADWLSEHGNFALIAGAIAAAVESMMAQTWQSGWKTGWDDRCEEIVTPNPYRVTQ